MLGPLNGKSVVLQCLGAALWVPVSTKALRGQRQEHTPTRCSRSPGWNLQRRGLGAGLSPLSDHHSRPQRTVPETQGFQVRWFREPRPLPTPNHLQAGEGRVLSSHPGLASQETSEEGQITKLL